MFKMLLKQTPNSLSE